MKEKRKIPSIKDSCILLTGPFPPPVDHGEIESEYEFEPIGSYNAKLWTVPDSGIDLELSIFFAEFDEDEGKHPIAAYRVSPNSDEELFHQVIAVLKEEDIQDELGKEEIKSIFMFSELVQFASGFIETGEVPVEETMYWTDIEEDDFEEDDQEDW